MTEFNLDPNEYAMTPIQLMKLRGASQQEILEYEKRRKRRLSKEWGSLQAKKSRSKVSQ